MEEVRVKDIVEALGGRLLCGNPEASLMHISIDSRVMKGNDLFVPLIGEKTDAHDFIGQALENGAAAVLTSRHSQMESHCPWIQVEDTRKALQAIGSWYRARLSLPLIGVTGSVGKTTAREMVAAALSARYKVYKTPGNSNSQVGVPITVSEITGEDEIGVIELGMSLPGEMERIAMVAKVSQAVITNIGLAHIGQLGSKENICREKLHIQDGMGEGGILYVNGDDPILAKVKAKKGCKRVSYGLSEGCDYQAVDMDVEEGKPVFTAVCKASGESAWVRLNVFGRHMAQNAMAALAVAAENGVPLKDGAKALEGFSGFQGRQQIIKANGITIIDDSYNASPVSMKAGIQVLRDMPVKGRRIAVLADMKELGDEASSYHQEIGKFLAKKPVDVLILLGDLAAEIGAGVRDGCKGDEGKLPQIHLFSHKDALKEWLPGQLRDGDCLLFKGSNSMGLKSVVLACQSNLTP